MICEDCGGDAGNYPFDVFYSAYADRIVCKHCWEEKYKELEEPQK